MGMVLFVYIATSFLILPSDERNDSLKGSKPTFNFSGTITEVTGLILFNFT